MPSSSIPSDPDALADIVKQTVVKHRMLSPKDRVLIGVSGGPDSMALLHLLDKMAVALDIRLGVAHLNHGLRGQAADDDARLVCRVAKRLGHPCHVTRADVIKVKRKLRTSLEDAAHRVRYAFFRATMLDKRYNKLALGHHMDDNAEHMLMAILRGAGPRGLSGIAPVRENRIIRPLINARRPHIEAYVEAKKIPCSEDVSNADQQIDRNRIRHHLLPLLTSDYNPRVTENLNRLADIMREEAEWTDASVDAAWEAALLDREHDAITLSSRMLTHVHLALSRRLMRKALKMLKGNIRRIGYNHIQAALDMAATLDGSPKTCHLPDGIRVQRCGHSVNITAGHAHRRRMADAPIARGEGTEAMVRGPFPTSIVVPELNMGLRFRVSRPDDRPRWTEVSDNRAYLDLDRLHLPLGVRRCLPGDRFTPLGAGGTQKVKKYFIDHHIPRHARARTPVLTDRRRIIWLIGQRIDDDVKITPHTSHILVAEFFLLDTR